MLNFSKILEEAEKYNIINFHHEDTNNENNIKLICFTNENSKNLIVLFIPNPNQNSNDLNVIKKIKNYLKYF